jgi:hypothetical protein
MNLSSPWPVVPFFVKLSLAPPSQKWDRAETAGLSLSKKLLTFVGLRGFIVADLPGTTLVGYPGYFQRAAAGCSGRSEYTHLHLSRDSCCF